MFKTNKAFRHGDINFSLAEKPTGTPVNKKSLVVAEGETSGHFHEVVGNIAVYEPIGEDIALFEVSEEAVIDHPEHGKVTLLPGTYRAWRERERDPFLGAIRNVID